MVQNVQASDSSKTTEDNSKSNTVNPENFEKFQNSFSLSESNLHYLNLIDKKIDSLSIPFIQNVGNLDPAIKFYANTFVGNVHVTDNDITYVLESDKKGRVYVIKEIFSDKPLQIQTVKEHLAQINYLKGSKNSWKTNIPTFSALKLVEVWPGIDMHLQVYGNNLEKTFNVKPGANPNNIVVTVDGVSNLQIKDDRIIFHGHSKFSKLIEFTKPIAFQLIDDKKQFVSVEFLKISSNQYGFSVGNYNSNYDLFIDPLIAATYLGGDSLDKAHGVALDNSGNVYVVGETFDSNSIPFPTTAGAVNQTNNGGDDVFISKFNPVLSQLLASTFFGGIETDIGNAIAVDSSGFVYITGETKETGSNESNFASTPGAYDETHNGGLSKKDVFVSKFNPDLSVLVASTFIGGGNDEQSFDILVDEMEGVYIVGKTRDASVDFPVTNNVYDTTILVDDEDGFIAKFSMDLTQLLSSTYLGNDVPDSIKGIALDSSSYVNVVGETLTNPSVTNFPTTPGAYSEEIVGSWDIFVSKLNPDLTSLINSTLIGGQSADRAGDIAIDSSGSVYITGTTTDSVPAYPTTSGAWDEIGNGDDIFVSKLSPTLDNLTSSTLLGGDGSELGVTLNIDTMGNVFVGGRGSDSFPTTNNAYQESGSGSVISKLNNDLTQLLASTFFSLGNSNAFVSSLVFDILGNVIFVGESSSIGTPIILPEGNFDTTHNGNLDAYVAKLTSDLSIICLPPESGVWIITSDCTISGEVLAPESVVIQNNSLVTINSGGTLTIQPGENIIVVLGSGLKLISGSSLQINS